MDRILFWKPVHILYEKEIAGREQIPICRKLAMNRYSVIR